MISRRECLLILLLLTLDGWEHLVAVVVGEHNSQKYLFKFSASELCKVTNYAMLPPSYLQRLCFT